MDPWTVDEQSNLFTDQQGKFWHCSKYDQSTTEHLDSWFVFLCDIVTGFNAVFSTNWTTVMATFRQMQIPATLYWQSQCINISLTRFLGEWAYPPHYQPPNTFSTHSCAINMNPLSFNLLSFRTIPPHIDNLSEA